mmetsp:Transcript_135889/g.234850  ORF Transcript_135889/g.234850 Transcript_135889/m.234850 type:complete len:84 (+) Transcript_135889:116-367(+)
MNYNASTASLSEKAFLLAPCTQNSTAQLIRLGVPSGLRSKQFADTVSQRHPASIDKAISKTGRQIARLRGEFIFQGKRRPKIQ